MAGKRMEVLRIQSYFTRGQMQKLARGKMVTTKVGEEHDGVQYQIRLLLLNNGEVRVVVREVQWDRGRDIQHIGGHFGNYKTGQKPAGDVGLSGQRDDDDDAGEDIPF